MVTAREARRTDHNHSHNYCIYASVCAMAWYRMVRGNTPGSAQLQSQLQHWIPAWIFSCFSQSCQAKIGHNNFLAHFPSQYPWRKENKPVSTPPATHFPNISTINITQIVQIQNFQTSQLVSISVVCYSLDNRGIVVHITLWARDLFLVQSIQTNAGNNKTFIFQEHQGCFPHGIKQPGPAADHSPPSTAKFKDEWSYTSTPHFNGMQRRNFTFTLTQDLKHCNISVKNNSPQCSSSFQVTGHT